MMDREFNRALRLYLGFGSSACPRRDREAVVAQFGKVSGALLVDRIELVLADLARIVPDWNAHSLASATEWAKAKMKARHDALDDGSLAALGWTFSYDWK